MTPGVNPETLDGISGEWFTETAQLIKSGKLDFQPLLHFVYSYKNQKRNEVCLVRLGRLGLAGLTLPHPTIPSNTSNPSPSTLNHYPLRLHECHCPGKAANEGNDCNCSYFSKNTHEFKFCPCVINCSQTRIQTLCGKENLGTPNGSLLNSMHNQ